MFLSRRMLFIPAASLAFACAVGLCTAAGAAPAKAKVTPASSKPAYGLTRVSVPTSMLQGSLLTKGRTFYRSTLPESTLADIRLGRPANSILAKWGNPTRITVGTAQAEVANIPAPSPAGPSYIPPGGGMYASPLAEGLNKAASMLGLQSSPMPPLGGFESPMGQPPMGAPTQQQPETRTLSQEEVTWTYDLPNGITLEFIITNGIITQVTVGGEGPWGLSKTRTGIQLGDSYKLVLWVMGFPEEPQRYVGRFLRVSYVDKNRVLFTFLNKKLVGVTIAMVPSEISIK